MAASWTRLCRGRKFKLDGESIVVSLGNGRGHRVEAEDIEGGIRLSAVVARKPQDGIALQAWRRNRAALLVGFRIDDVGKLIAEAIVPAAGITPDEFDAWVSTVAAEADRFEAALTGQDTE